MGKMIFIILISLIAISAVSAAVKPNGLISDNAVLQQGIKLPIWGTADEGEKVTVQFQCQKVSTTAHNGFWMVHLKPLKAGGPYTMKINDLEIKNLLVGEVWVCSGQSNMAFQMSRVENAEAEIKAANDPMLRLYTVPRAQKLQELPPGWNEANPDSVPGFSAVAYFFGKHLRESLKVPVGLINTSVGGTAAEAWTSRPVLKSISGFLSPSRPAYLYNGMIAPLLPYAIKGAIWYQGEANAPRAYQYQVLLSTMIWNWREAWGQEDDFPFLIVQLAPYGKAGMPGSWPELREAQLKVTQTVPKTGMAVITDIGEELNIHPVKKEPVGSRLALAARAIAYGEAIEYSGPIYRSMKADGGKIVLSFSNVGGGLVAKDGPLTGFTIAGEDRNFVPAQAEIVGDTVVVSSPDVSKPIAVRYGWSDWMVVNLFNQADLPATPFRTDRFPGITGPR